VNLAFARTCPDPTAAVRQLVGRAFGSAERLRDPRSQPGDPAGGVVG
jgi:hypothetical protein